MTYTIEIEDRGIVMHKITLSDTQSDTQIAQKKCKKYGITSDHIKNIIALNRQIVSYFRGLIDVDLWCQRGDLNSRPPAYEGLKINLV